MLINVVPPLLIDRHLRSNDLGPPFPIFRGFESSGNVNDRPSKDYTCKGFGFKSSEKRKLVPQIEDKLLFSELILGEVEDVDGTL